MRPAQSRYVNTFKGLLSHARSGEGFTLHNKGTGAAPQLLLINTSGVEGRDKCYTFPYPVFEKAVLDLLREVNPKDVLPRKGEEPSKADVLRQAGQRSFRPGRFERRPTRKYSKAIAAVLRDREAEEELIAAELQEEVSRRPVVPAERAWKELPSLLSLIENADDPDAVRLKIRGVLRRVIESIWVLTVRRGAVCLCVVQVFFVGGGVRGYMIHHKTAGFRRSGGWTVDSLDPEFAAPAGKKGSLDLRRREDAAKLAEDLEALPSWDGFTPIKGSDDGDV